MGFLSDLFGGKKKSDSNSTTDLTTTQNLTANIDEHRDALAAEVGLTREQVDEAVRVLGQGRTQEQTDEAIRSLSQGKTQEEVNEAIRSLSESQTQEQTAESTRAETLGLTQEQLNEAVRAFEQMSSQEQQQFLTELSEQERQLLQEAQTSKETTTQKVEKDVSAFQNIPVSSSSELKLHLDRAVALDELQPEQARAILQQRTELEGLRPDPAVEQIQMETLGQLQALASTGEDAISKQALARLYDNQTQEARAARERVKQSFAERGVSGAGTELVAQLSANEQARRMNSEQEFNTAAQADARRRAALSEVGAQAGALRTQDMAEKTRVAEGQDRINAYNTANLQTAELANLEQRARTRELNQDEKRRVQELNIALGKEEAVSGVNAAKTQFEQQMERAKGLSGTYSGMGTTTNVTEAEQQRQQQNNTARDQTQQQTGTTNTASTAAKDQTRTGTTDTATQNVQDQTRTGTTNTATQALQDQQRVGTTNTATQTLEDQQRTGTTDTSTQTLQDQQRTGTTTGTTANVGITDETATRDIDQTTTGTEHGTAHNSGVTRDATQGLKNIGSVIGMIGGLSDARMKENITPESGSDLDRFLDEVTGYKYQYKQQAQDKGLGSPGVKTGPMAQDLERVPGLESVVQDTPNGKMVNISELSLALTALVDSLGERVRKLEERKNG